MTLARSASDSSLKSSGVAGSASPERAATKPVTTVLLHVGTHRSGTGDGEGARLHLAAAA